MQTRLRSIAIGSLVTVSALVACSGRTADGDGAADAGAEQTTAEACASFAEAAGWTEGEAVAPTAEASAERMSAVGEETWQLALELLAVVPTSQLANVAQSPASMYASLGLAYGRFQGNDCAVRIGEVMHFPEEGDGIHEAIGSSLRALQARSLPAIPAGDENEEDVDAVSVQLSQSTWAIGSPEVPAVSELARQYGATANAVLDKGGAARDLVNCVIEHQSHGLLKDFITPGIINSETSSLDINVTYLKAPWKAGFSEARVPFTPEGGSALVVAGLSEETLTAPLYAGATFDAIQLSLRGDKLKVMLVVPNATVTSTLDDFAATLTPEELRAARDEAVVDAVQFHMPAVDIQSKTLNYYEPLGFACPEFTLGDVLHGAAVAMDEGGIEASAATVSVSYTDGGGPQIPEREFFVERPFLFFVYDIDTRVVLFNGRMSTP